ncbi:zinc-binding dehydrogenase [Actinocrinis puniceicyclus]|uniref:Zinc-binding dehydrogenase n=1 Tax=Actinocrinis puniceicyclus TaxID=977794 RepID=A0A8J8BF44_9ACTN|nr:zinc-binding dehydrogenase [Actinocrinis puniceicyclus]MBS2964389.1 zinc-binding dehydrogenase [Actinocrinis puniceicyclus]
MRALVPTGPETKTVEFGDVPEPEPKPHELVIAVEALSINRGETFLLADPNPGWRPGKDIAGTVVAAAGDGTGPRPGTRVVGHPWYSGWAELAAVPAESVAVLPETVGAESAAVLPLAGITALRLLRRSGLGYGDRALITGASGGVGHYFVELAAAAGVRVTAVTATAERGSRLLELGAEAVVRQAGDAAGQYDAVLESVGAEVFPQALAKLRAGGLLLQFGQASRVAPVLDFFSFFRGPKQARIEHFDYTIGERTYGAELETLVRLVEQGRLHPEIGFTGDWGQAPDAIAALRERAVRGNIALTVK